MNCHWKFVGYAVIVPVLFGLAAARIVAEDKAQSAAPAEAPAEPAAEADFAAPGPAHESFKHMVGTWKTKTTLFFENQAAPETSAGTATFRLLMGGRYVQQDFRGTFGGEKFEGRGITGFDKAKQKYVGIWIDNMGTGIMSTEGEFDPKTMTMTEVGETSTPDGPMKIKSVGKHLDDKTFLFTMYVVIPQVGEQKMMEVTYTRADSEKK